MALDRPIRVGRSPVTVAVRPAPTGTGPRGEWVAAWTVTLKLFWSGLLPIRVRVALVIVVAARAGMASP